MVNFLKNKQALAGLAIVAAIAVVFVLQAKPWQKHSAQQTTSADSDFLRSQMKVCVQTAGDLAGDNCYKKVADTLMGKYSYVTILSLLHDNEQYPEIFGRCHELTHYIGRMAYEQEQSVAKVYANASAVCWGGFYHGVMEAYFADKHLSLTNIDDPKIITDLNTACGKESDYQSPRFYTECIHGIGHAMMFITNTDLNKSLALCDKLGGQAITCYGGVFMENSSSSTNTAHPTKFLSSSDPFYPCDSLVTKYLYTCYQYQSSYFGQLSNYDWQKNGQLCSQIPVAYQPGCFNIIGSNQVGFTQDYSVMKASCNTMPDVQDRNYCLGGVVDGLSGRYVGQIEKVADFCKIVDDADKKTCYTNIGNNTRGWTQDQASFEANCALLGSPEYVEWCKGNTNYNPSNQSFN